jgi:hypothetical protein
LERFSWPESKTQLCSYLRFLLRAVTLNTKLRKILNAGNSALEIDDLGSMKFNIK